MSFASYLQEFGYEMFEQDERREYKTERSNFEYNTQGFRQVFKCTKFTALFGHL